MKRQEWEYATDSFIGDPENYLAPWGEEGWELVTVYNGFLIFKRPK